MSLPPETDDAGQPSTLPLPELNPLLNPLLGQHMGRWAEAYFTSVPEKREEAVLELLRELEKEAENPPAEDAAEPPSNIPDPAGLPPRAYRFTDESPALVSCRSCGRKNAAQQNFCGMCGARLHHERAAAEFLPDELRTDWQTSERAASNANLETADLEEEVDSETDLENDRLQKHPQTESRIELPIDSQNGPQNDHPPIAGRQLEPVQDWVSNSLSSAGPADRSAVMPSLGPRLPVDREAKSRNYDYDEPGTAPPSNSYRMYIGAALALLVMALFFIAWRGKQATSEISAAPEAAKPALAEQPSASIPTRAGGRTQALAPSHRAAEHAAAETGSIQAAAGPGSAELATAQSYLDGTGGKERNSEEAAQWLWKAVAKQNADATLRLADLYLKGEGVAKNCDQARVLLDAAAHKGTKGAAERLSQLQSFGCA